MTSTAYLEAFRIFIYGSDAAPALLASDSDRHGLNLYIYIFCTILHSLPFSRFHYDIHFALCSQLLIVSINSTDWFDCTAIHNHMTDSSVHHNFHLRSGWSYRVGHLCMHAPVVPHRFQIQQTFQLISFIESSNLTDVYKHFSLILL